MTAPVSCETGARVPFRNAVDLCAFVDRLPADDVGELLVGRDEGRAFGTVFVERGRVCWAAARGLAPRLAQLLTEAARVAPNEMEEHLLRCKREGKGLGDFVAEKGVVPSREFRQTLLQHSVESLDALCSGETSGAWRARTCGFNPRFTFDTSELLARAAAHAHVEEAASSVRALAALSSLRPGEWGAAFLRLRTLASPLPIAVTGSWPDKSLILTKIGKWAASTLDVSQIFQDDDALVTTMDGTDGGALVAWRSDQLLIVGRLLSQGTARILNYRATARRRELSAHQARGE